MSNNDRRPLEQDEATAQMAELLRSLGIDPYSRIVRESLQDLGDTDLQTRRKAFAALWSVGADAATQILASPITESETCDLYRAASAELLLFGVENRNTEIVVAVVEAANPALLVALTFLLTAVGPGAIAPILSFLRAFDRQQREAALAEMESLAGQHDLGFALLKRLTAEGTDS